MVDTIYPRAAGAYYKEIPFRKRGGRRKIVAAATGDYLELQSRRAEDPAGYHHGIEPVEPDPESAQLDGRRRFGQQLTLQVPHPGIYGVAGRRTGRNPLRMLDTSVSGFARELEALLDRS